MKRSWVGRSISKAVLVALAMILLSAQAASAYPFLSSLGQAVGLRTDSTYTGGSGGTTSAYYALASTPSSSGGDSGQIIHPSFAGSTATFFLRTGKMVSQAAAAVAPGEVDSVANVFDVDMIIGTPTPPCGDLITCILWALFPPAPTSVRIQADKIVSRAFVGCDSPTTGRQTVSTQYQNLRINGQVVTPSASPNVTSHQFGYTITFNKDTSSQTLVGGRLVNVANRTGIWVQRDGASTAVELAKAFSFERC